LVWQAGWTMLFPLVSRRGLVVYSQNSPLLAHESFRVPSSLTTIYTTALLSSIIIKAVFVLENEK